MSEQPPYEQPPQYGAPQQPYGQQPYGQPQQPYGAPPGYGPRVPSSVNIASIFLFISGGFALLGGLLLLVIGTVAAWAAMVGVVYVAIGGFQIYTGLKLRKLVPWARTATIVLAGLGALIGVISLFRGGYTSFIGIGLDIYTIVLMYRPDTLQAFPDSTRPGGI